MSLFAGLYCMRSDGDGADEVTGPGYTRVKLSVADVQQATGGETSVVFPTATGDWGTIVGFVLFSKPEDGEPLFHIAFGNYPTVRPGDNIRSDFSVGEDMAPMLTTIAGREKCYGCSEERVTVDDTGYCRTCQRAEYGPRLPVKTVWQRLMEDDEATA